MALFQESVNTQAYAKLGILGFAAAGKTFTGTRIAIGLIQLMQSRGLELANKPAMFLDTETGSDWVKPQFDKAGIKLFTAKTRAFADLLTAVDEAEKNGSVLLIDSISHFWREICDAYLRKKNEGRRKKGWSPVTRLEFQDWATIKAEWGKFTDKFINSNIHIIMCGRAGFEYDYFENDDGKKELEKTGIKMKAETELGYEPSLLIFMERSQNIETKKVTRVASILKDRSTLLDGKQFTNPDFKDFKPHFEFLNLGGKQLGIDTSRTSQELFDEDGNSDFTRDRRLKEIALDEVVEVLNKHYSGLSADAKRAKGDLLEKHAGTRSWERIKIMSRKDVEEIRNRLWKELEGIDYAFVRPPVAEPIPEEHPIELTEDVSFE
jgi:hypothetical protein